MKKGDRLRVVGSAKLPNGRKRPVVEYELDDGAPAQAILAPESDGQALGAAPDNLRITARRAGKGILEVQEVHRGPARTSSAAYRAGWESIFGAPRPDDTVN
jgi:hypothetical protein